MMESRASFLPPYFSMALSRVFIAGLLSMLFVSLLRAGREPRVRIRHRFLQLFPIGVGEVFKPSLKFYIVFYWPRLDNRYAHQAGALRHFI